MSDKGFARAYRRRWTHPAFRDYAEAAVWAWMCDTAAWRPMTVSTQFGPVSLERGQLLIAQNIIAREFEMGRKKVRLLIHRLVQEKMISLNSDHPAANAGTICTILNYDKYQSDADADDNAGANLASEKGQPRANPGPTSGQPRPATPGKETENRLLRKGRKEEREEKKEGAPAGAASQGKYAFGGPDTTVRLIPKHYEEWQVMCPNLVRLGIFDSTLHAREAWYRWPENEDKRKKWFNPTSNWMRRQDREAAVELQRVGEGRGRREPQRQPYGEGWLDLDEIIDLNDPDLFPAGLDG